ncbi:NupC/NupG family nucleoside CNT transporter [Botrimarina mediterranea]|uniref:Nucleoside permease NupX n=1 Tax=Botrimarina mediterranea TaxID=2528022 RepID=A0A518K6T9_9BACT|nr:nucleoside transporter C-terminal domain-containing protein [Botrimarina mediterranea]QDV73513.1 Nucleoside permease NupX [Botrimarina mediterranea]QDV78104.1 Nucleoside permease NupX [Planctomycetes bacterium K2D]
MDRFSSLLGLIVIIGLAWLMSSHKTKFPLRVVIGGVLLQFAFALVILKTSFGQSVFVAVDKVFVGLLSCVDAGTVFVFGEDFAEHFFAFRVLPTIIFFSAFMSIFYYYGVIQKVVGLLAIVMQKTLGTSGAETLSSAANIFVGQTEAPLVIKPYIATMTKSELNAVMVGGFATMAGGVLGALSAMGINAGNLLAASVISAPGALLLAKVMQPEVDEPKTRGHVGVEVEDESVNVLEAISNGTTGGLSLALNVGAMLIVFLALIAVVNSIFGLAGDAFWHVAELAGQSVPEDPARWSLEGLLGWLFWPVAWLIGIESADCSAAGQLMGLKMATNEFVAYGKLAEWQSTGADAVISERTRQLMTFALCGFANFSSIGIQLGGIGSLAPERRGDLAKLGLRAMIGGTLASFLTACIAAILL